MLIGVTSLAEITAEPGTRTFRASHVYAWHTWGQSCGPWEQMKATQGAEADALDACFTIKANCIVVHSSIKKNGDLECDEGPGCTIEGGIAYSGCIATAIVRGR